MVRGLSAGGRWIRTSSTREKLVVAPFDVPGCLGRIGSRRSDPATAIRARRRDNPSFSDWADLPSVMRTKRNISGAARPTIERVDELQNQE